MPLILLVAAQIRARAFHPLLYWATIIASTTAGTTLADFCTRFLGEGTNASYALGSAILLTCVLATLASWRAIMGTVSVESVREPKAEMFYWATITFSQTLGTALGDWTANSAIMGHQIGFTGGALIFGAALAVVALLHCRTTLSRAALFWAAFILTRPLGATVGDVLDKPHAKGGLDFSRPVASLALIAAIAVCLWTFPQRPATADAGH